MQKKKVVKRGINMRSPRQRNTIKLKMNFRVMNNNDEVIEDIIEERVEELKIKTNRKSKKHKVEEPIIENNELKEE